MVGFSGKKFDPDSPANSAYGRFSVEHDRWDSSDYFSLQAEIGRLSKAEADLLGITDTGREAIADSYYSLKKALVEIKEDEEVRPEFIVNRFVMEQYTGLEEHQDLRMTTVADEVAAAFATIDMEPTLEELFSDLQDEMDQAKQLQEMFEAAMEEARANAQDPGNKEGGNSTAAQEAYEGGLEEIMDKLEGKAVEIREKLREAVSEASDKIDASEQMYNSFGLSPSEISKLSIDERLDYMERLNNSRTLKLSKLFGALVRVANTKRRGRPTRSNSSICRVENGGDLNKLLPSSWAMAQDETLRALFYMQFLDQALPQYELISRKTTERGGIIYCQDSSGSMSGDREVWATAMGLAFLSICRDEKRQFTGIQFSGSDDYVMHNFVKSECQITERSGETRHVSQAEGVIDFGETAFFGGTDFHTPLALSLRTLREQYETTGAVEGDIVFVTDGEAQLSEQFLEEFQKEKDELGFKVYGICVGSQLVPDIMHKFCDATITSLAIEDFDEDVYSVFAKV